MFPELMAAFPNGAAAMTAWDAQEAERVASTAALNRLCLSERVETLRALEADAERVGASTAAGAARVATLLRSEVAHRLRGCADCGGCIMASEANARLPH